MNNIDEVKAFYRQKLAEHGPTAQGMGHRDETTHLSRLIRVSYYSQPIRGETLLDIGCGIGMYADIHRLRLDQNSDEFMPFYTGIDVVPEYIAQAKQKYPDYRDRFMVGDFLGTEFEDKFDNVYMIGTTAWFTHEVARVMVIKAWELAKNSLTITALQDRPFNKLELVNGPIWLSPRPQRITYHTGYLSPGPVGPGEGIYVFGK